MHKLGSAASTQAKCTLEKAGRPPHGSWHSLEDISPFKYYTTYHGNFISTFPPQMFPAGEQLHFPNYCRSTY
jgi:hypothetical protein